MVSACTHAGAIRDVTLLARGLVYGSPIIDQVRARGGVEPEQIVDKLVAEFRREFAGGTMPLRAIVFEAVKGA